MSPRFFDTDPLLPGVQETTVIRRSDRKSRDQISDIIANQTDFTFDFSTGPVEHHWFQESNMTVKPT